MIYILKSGMWYKIGYAQDVIKRVCQYGSYNPDVEFIAYGDGDKKTESEIHSILKEKKHKYRKEWFCADKQQIDYIVYKYNLNDAKEHNERIFFTTYKEKKRIACQKLPRETRLRLSKAGRKSFLKRKFTTIKYPKRKIGVVMPSRSRAVIQLSLDGDFIAEHLTLSNASRAIGMGNRVAAHIRECCIGERLSASGYRWIWKTNEHYKE